jgi:hypothetical protein
MSGYIPGGGGRLFILMELTHAFTVPQYITLLLNQLLNQLCMSQFHDLIGYDSVNARVPGHNLKTNAPPRGRFYSRFHETLTTNVRNFVAKFASSLRSSEAHIGIHKPICKQSPRLVCEVKEANQTRSLRTGL